jgi:hypothetical protein
MTFRRPIITALLVLLCPLSWAPGAFGQTSGGRLGPTGTSLAVKVGWGGRVKQDRWNPVYITLSDPATRNVLFEFRAPHGGFSGMKSRQVISIGPEPQTFVVYMPLRQFMPEDLSFVVRDAATRKKLADYPGDPFFSFAPVGPVSPGYSLLGISGKRVTLRPLINTLPGARLDASHIETEELPTAAIGYDCLDVLILNGPDFTALLPEQQQAMLEWVRTGGNLLLWPGDTPVPESGALVDALPCRIGNTRVIELSADELKAAGLSARFGKLSARALEPRPDATPVVLLGTEKVTAYQRRLGLGRVMVCPTDLSALQISNPSKTWAMWRAVLKGMLRRLPDDAAAQSNESYYAGVSESQVREATALRQVGDQLGTVPGAGSFGFGYVAGVLIGMMVVVGPVDWFVLKKLGRQPWTWATTTGWVALVTLSAVYAGHLFKSGELHWRTFELVDQADGVVVARTDLAALYSPRTTEYAIETRPDAWWQPASPGDEVYGYRRGAQDVTFAQTYRGSTPDPMVVNVWNLRFLRGETTAAAPAMIEADLRVEERPVEGRPRKYLVGTITNAGVEPLVSVAVRTRAGWARPFSKGGATQPAEPVRIEPGQTVEVDSMIDTSAPAAPSDRAADWRRMRYPYYGADISQLNRSRLWDQGGDLSMRRTDRIEQWVTERDDLACVYAQCENAPPAAELVAAQAVEAHWKVVRALVTLTKPQP